MNIILHEPRIPYNTGNIGRTCVDSGSSLHLIEPFGFILSDKNIKRAGMDYWDRLDVTRYMNYEDFKKKHPDATIWYATTKAHQSYDEVAFGADDYIMFGREDAGIPEEILVDNEEHCIRIPMLPNERSLNLCNSVAIVLYEALRQNGFPGLESKGKLHELEWKEEAENTLVNGINLIDNSKIILASGSPRRTELLNSIGIDHEVISSEADENSDERNPEKLVRLLSERKAEEVFNRIKNTTDGNITVIGADTLVSKDDVIFGKPESDEDAKRILNCLSGAEHQVFSGVSIFTRIDGKEYIKVFSEKTCVNVRQISEKDIDDYIRSGEGADKAGAYGIQTSFMKHISSINGDYFNIVGLPVSRLYTELSNYCSQANCALRCAVMPQ